MPARYVVAASALLIASLCLVSAAGASSASRLTAPQYRAKAKPICERAKRSIPPVGNGHEDTAQFVAAMTAMAKIETSELHALRGLIPPVGLVSLVRQGLHDKMVLIAFAKKSAREAKSGSLSLQQAIAGLLSLPNPAPTWRKIGVPVCQW